VSRSLALISHGAAAASLRSLPASVSEDLHILVVSGYSEGKASASSIADAAASPKPGMT
jgi:hypothetical protein